MARKNVKYRKHQSQKGHPMWRDPSHAQGGSGGCAVVALALVAVPVAVAVGAVWLA